MSYKIEDYICKRIFYLTPIRESNETSSDGSKKWEFECVCGKHIFETPYRVIYGHKKSCGCMRYKNMRSGPKEHGNRSKINPYSYIGLKNNKLTVIGYTNPEKRGRLKLKCLCDCGNITYVLPYQFNKGEIQSCGCRRKNLWDGKRDLPWAYKHGYSYDRLYRKFQKMKQRCYNPNAEQYERYGARGITICQKWLDNPGLFVEWAIKNGGLDKSLTIDRIDGSGPYSPDNCRFITTKEQQRNLRSNKILEYNGESHCMSEWSEIFNINYKVLSGRINRGWSVERALTEPINQKFNNKKCKD